MDVGVLSNQLMLWRCHVPVSIDRSVTPPAASVAPSGWCSRCGRTYAHNTTVVSVAEVTPST